MKALKFFGIIVIMATSSILTVNAHDSHTHEAPWQACSEKQKSQDCSYNNGAGDLFKGSCQLFSEVLMCVRNQPIIQVEDLAKNTELKKLNKTTHTTHSHK